MKKSTSGLQGLLLAGAMGVAGVAWGAPGDPVHGVDVKLGFEAGAAIESSPVSSVRGGGVAIRSAREAGSGIATGRRMKRPGKPVYGNITFERAVGKSAAWREAGSGLATGRRQHKPMVMMMTYADDSGAVVRTSTWHDLTVVEYGVVQSTDASGRPTAIEQITFEVGWAEFASTNKGGTGKGTIAVDLDRDGALDFTATRQSLSYDPNEGFAPGSSEDPSMSVTWTVDTAGPTVEFFRKLGEVVGADAGKRTAGPLLNATVSVDGKTVDEFPDTRICGYVPPQLGEDALGETAAASDRVLVCGKTDHF